MQANKPLDEIRSANSAAKLEGKTIAGVCIPYNSEASLGDGLFEVIRPGAVSEFLRSNPRIAAIYEHKPECLLGTTADRTLQLVDSQDALRFTIEPPEGVSYAEDLKRSMTANPAAFGASFHMRIEPKGYKWIKRSDGSYLREITRIANMREVTITAFPVYTDTSAMLRSVQQLRQDNAGAAAVVTLCQVRKRTLQ